MWKASATARDGPQQSWCEDFWQLLQELDAYGAETFTPGDLAKLPYLEACLKEAMRLYPPGVFLIREPLTEDFHLQGYTIPKGTWIHVRLLHIAPWEPAMHDVVRGVLWSWGLFSQASELL